MTPTVADSTSCADASSHSEDVQKRVTHRPLWFISGWGHLVFRFVFKLVLPVIQSRSSRTEEPVFPRLCPDDADAGEIKKSHKSARRRQKEAANNQKREEALKRQWEAHRSSVSSHSSGDEVLLLLPMFVLNSTIKSCVNVWDLCLLQGEESVVTRLALPTEMLQNPHAEAAPRKSNENTEGDGDPKTGNTCNALSGKVQQRRRTPISLQTHVNAL